MAGLFYAAIMLGAIAAPLNGWWSGEELLYGLGQRREDLIADGDRFARIADHVGECPALEKIVTRASRRAGSTALESIIGERVDGRHSRQACSFGRDIDPDDDASILYTSGRRAIPRVRSRRIAIRPAPSLPRNSPVREFRSRGEPVPTPDPDFQRAC